MRVDFHLHSRASDGAHPATEMAAAAAAARLRHWSLTDHDTLAGWRTIAAAPGLIPGVELSTTWLGREVHIVGLGFRPDDAGLTNLLAANRKVRLTRLEALINRLPTEARTSITVASIAAEANNGPEGSLGRNHLARALTRSGAVTGSQEAFARWLADEHLVDQDVPAFGSPADAAEVVRAAGGIAILAHPGCYGELPLILTLMACGLDGIETCHPNLSSQLAQGLRKLAARHGWLQSCGTDLHHLGVRRPGDCTLGAERLRPLLDRLVAEPGISPSSR